MRMPGAHSTISNLDVGTGLMAIAAAQALRDGMIRSQAMAAEDKAHAVGARRYNAIIQHKLNIQQAAAVDAVGALMRDRKRLHG